MKRNKKISGHEGLSTSLFTVAVIFSAFGMGMLYWSQDAKCSDVEHEIGCAKKELKRLERDCQREAANWEELKTPEKLRVALLRHGLDMDAANMDQVIHMGSNGRPAPGQMSVARIQTRRGTAMQVDASLPQRTVRPAVRARKSRR